MLLVDVQRPECFTLEPRVRSAASNGPGLFALDTLFSVQVQIIEAPAEQLIGVHLLNPVFLHVFDVCLGTEQVQLLEGLLQEDASTPFLEVMVRLLLISDDVTVAMPESQAKSELLLGVRYHHLDKLLQINLFLTRRATVGGYPYRWLVAVPGLGQCGVAAGCAWRS